MNVSTSSVPRGRYLADPLAKSMGRTALEVAEDNGHGDLLLRLTAACNVDYFAT